MERKLPTRRWITLAIIALIFFSPAFLQGCDALMDADPNETINNRTESATSIDKLRQPQLLDRAMRNASTNEAGKLAGSEVHLYLAFNEYVANGITPRLLNRYDVIRRHPARAESVWPCYALRRRNYRGDACPVQYHN